MEQLEERIRILEEELHKHRKGEFIDRYCGFYFDCGLSEVFEEYANDYFEECKRLGRRLFNFVMRERLFEAHADIDLFDRAMCIGYTEAKNAHDKDTLERLFTKPNFSIMERALLAQYVYKHWRNDKLHYDIVRIALDAGMCNRLENLSWYRFTRHYDDSAFIECCGWFVENKITYDEFKLLIVLNPEASIPKKDPPEDKEGRQLWIENIFY